jgi:hypothetical protein
MDYSDVAWAGKLTYRVAVSVTLTDFYEADSYSEAEELAAKDAKLELEKITNFITQIDETEAYVE